MKSLSLLIFVICQFSQQVSAAETVHFTIFSPSNNKLKTRIILKSNFKKTHNNPTLIAPSDKPSNSSKEPVKKDIKDTKKKSK